MSRIESLAKKYLAEVKRLEGEGAKLLKEMKDLTALAGKAEPPKVVIKGLVKTYMDAVKETDGLTSVRPATLKAVQAAEKDPTRASVSDAVKQLEAHADAVTKEAKANKKGAAAFDKDIQAIVKQLEALLK